MTGPGSSLRFGTAAGGRRSEDGPLLTGRGRFTDDVDVPGQAHAAFARSPVAHGIIRAVDTSRALALPGVLAVLTGRDVVSAGLGAIPPAASFPGRGGKPLATAPIPPLAVDRVRYVGESVAIVVAETP
ncbi:MAG TPA: xanthine dehydrogenase family protein molybdopterin-binding subunit, partial [Candidatus Eisenbacteria bacterium]|nr:xanthine dehydrogenase family protein molybdopterin-binding subunit [Candidatus Eisenbacteria bacterium]